MTPDEFLQFAPDEAAMLQVGANLANVCSAPLTLFLYGNLGAGKTTLSRGFLRGLGYTGTVKSPTYTIVEPYELGSQTLYHFDFYRINDVEELEFIGIQDYFAADAIRLIEWPELGAGLLPPADLSCYIEPQDSGRAIKLIAHSATGHAILIRLRNDK